MQAEESSRPEGSPKKAVLFNRIALILAIFTIFVMCFSLSVGYYVATRPIASPTPTETAVITQTAVPVPTKTEPPSARITDPAPKAAYLPGLNPKDLVQTYQRKMYHCDQPTLTAAGLHQWTCTQNTSYSSTKVQFLSRTEETIDQIAATIQVTTPGGHSGEAANFFSQTVQLEYTAAVPTQASDWVRRKVTSLKPGDELHGVFGDVLFTLSRTSVDWTLTIGELPSE